MKLYRIFKKGRKETYGCCVDEYEEKKKMGIEFSEKLNKEIDAFLEDFINKEFWFDDTWYAVVCMDDETVARIALADTYEEAYEIAKRYKKNLIDSMPNRW